MTLREKLNYTPVELRFGTSGRRGRVVDLTQLEVYLNALAELEFLQSLPRKQGGIARGEECFYAYDLRPSSCAFVPGQGGRGEIAQAIEAAIRAAGLRPVNLGAIPTPALACYALARGRASFMITGSHIPFDRNGYKANTSVGELLKEHEGPIAARVADIRRRLYDQPLAASPFNESGLFKDGHRELGAAEPGARAAYVSRYVDFFGPGALTGLRLIVYQHSAVGRDLLVEILSALGAFVAPAGRSDEFVPIDTENIDAAEQARIQSLVDEATAVHGPFDAVVSTDGDSDRPLLLGIEPPAHAVRFFPGDLLGMIAAGYLGADAVVVPISCNDAIDRGPLRDVLEPKTQIGSPYVIAGMQTALARGRTRVCGWEANGGFLTASPFTLGSRTLAPLPTRDAVLPILACLAAARERGLGLSELFATLPARFGRSALLKEFPRSLGLAIIQRFSRPQDRDALARFFPPEAGFGAIAGVDYTDGLRITFSNGEVAHLRPSGNADEMRIYAVADSVSRAEAIAQAGVREPDGILRRLERFVESEAGE